MTDAIVIHRQSAGHLHPEIGKPFRWFLDSRGDRYWISRGGPGWGYELYPDNLASTDKPIDGFFTLNDIRKWASQ